MPAAVGSSHPSLGQEMLQMPTFARQAAAARSRPGLRWGRSPLSLEGGQTVRPLAQGLL